MPLNEKLPDLGVCNFCGMECEPYLRAHTKCFQDWADKQNPRKKHA